VTHAGRFEASVVGARDAARARQSSAYGQHSAEPPGLRHRVAEWSARVRPAWLRQKSYALQRRLQRGWTGPGGLMAPDYLGRVIDLDYPAMRRFFRIERIRDEAMLMRIANLEYLAATLGSRVAA